MKEDTVTNKDGSRFYVTCALRENKMVEIKEIVIVGFLKNKTNINSG